MCGLRSLVSFCLPQNVVLLVGTNITVDFSDEILLLFHAHFVSVSLIKLAELTQQNKQGYRQNNFITKCQRQLIFDISVYPLILKCSVSN